MIFWRKKISSRKNANFIVFWEFELALKYRCFVLDIITHVFCFLSFRLCVKNKKTSNWNPLLRGFGLLFTFEPTAEVPNLTHEEPQKTWKRSILQHRRASQLVFFQVVVLLSTTKWKIDNYIARFCLEIFFFKWKCRPSLKWYRV